VFRVGPYSAQWHLVGPEGSFDQNAVDRMWARPSLRSAQHDRGPACVCRRTTVAGSSLDEPNLLVRVAQDAQQLGKYDAGIGSRHDDRLPTLTVQEVDDVLVAAAPEDGRPGDLGTVEIENRQDGPVSACVEKCGKLPRTSQWSGLGLAVADDAGDRQIWTIEGGAARMHQRIPELTALVDAPRRLDTDVARNPARSGELTAQPSDSVGVRPDVRVDLGIRSFEVRRRDQCRSTVAGPGDVQPIGVGVLDVSVQQRVDHRQTGTGPPVAEQPRLDVRCIEGLAQQSVVLQVDLGHGQVVRSSPPREVEIEVFGRVLVSGHRRPFLVYIPRLSSPHVNTRVISGDECDALVLDPPTGTPELRRAPVAQGIERSPPERKAAGSNPAGGTQIVTFEPAPRGAGSNVPLLECRTVRALPLPLRHRRSRSGIADPVRLGHDSLYYVARQHF
jgi:hypothetical protein